MSDYYDALARELDREPICTCTETQRGTDPLGCEIHDDPAAARAPGGAEEGET